MLIEGQGVETPDRGVGGWGEEGVMLIEGQGVETPDRGGGVGGGGCGAD